MATRLASITHSTTPESPAHGHGRDHRMTALGIVILVLLALAFLTIARMTGNG